MKNGSYKAFSQDCDEDGEIEKECWKNKNDQPHDDSSSDRFSAEELLWNVPVFTEIPVIQAFLGWKAAV